MARRETQTVQSRINSDNMAVGFTVKYYWYQIGTGDFLYSFFSTIAVNLEKRKWGSLFPCIMNDLYNGDLPQEKLQTALDELEEITVKLQAFSPDKVVWDFDKLEKRPPWGDNINSEITDLSNYFVTSDGEDLITILHHAIEKGMALGQNVKITKM